MACKEGQFDVVELMVNDQFKTFGINLNAQHVNGRTLLNLTIHIRKLVILDTLEYILDVQSLRDQSKLFLSNDK